FIYKNLTRYLMYNHTMYSINEMMNHIGKRFYNRYKDYILLNKNIIIAGTAALVVGVFFTELYAEYSKNNFLNSIVTLIVEYAIYIPLFAIFYYLDNKGRYVDALTGKKNYANIKSDQIKLFTIFSISEIIYSVSKVSIHFQLMQISFEPYQATIIGSFIAWFIFLVVINFGAKVVKLFQHSNN
ncbi:MAG TPA: hypothetical protein VL854_03595, partial [Nitrososphaeraceae archaeon]|nr:hypothetical protein [Nitrososphaeraceae archaeon]